MQSYVKKPEPELDVLCEFVMTLYRSYAFNTQMNPDLLRMTLDVLFYTSFWRFDVLDLSLVCLHHICKT